MPHNNHLNYEFGPYQFDLSKRELKCAGEIIALNRKATEILVMLLANAGEVVEKEELLREVWPNTFVEEANLAQHVFTLRKALGDERAVPRYIETVTRRGYRFLGVVRVMEADRNNNGNGHSAAYLSQGLGAQADHIPIVAVLPFINVMGDPELEYLVQGITDNIITNLSRISKLRVMSRSSVLRYKTKQVDPQQAGRELGANVVLIGKINSRDGHNLIDVELVNAFAGWLLWGESFDSEEKDLLEVQDVITRQIVAKLKLQLSGDEENQITARYTENAEAYQSYLEGRHHWSRYTRSGIERAIGHFRQAIELDPNYALAYAGIIDCYLRLATNYLPPEDDAPAPGDDSAQASGAGESDPRVKLRFEWDWKGAERELRRANELQTNYPTAPQWYAAYKTSEGLYENLCKGSDQSNHTIECRPAKKPIVSQIASLDLTASEQIQVYCTVSREQIDAGNYDAACRILRPWWVFGSWPQLESLNQRSCADLLFTTGELAGFVASTHQIPRGQRHAEELLIGSITLFEQLGLKRRVAEGRIELALCYYRQGLFDVGRSMLVQVLNCVSTDDSELRSLALIRLASLERHAGRLRDALDRLIEATDTVKPSGPWATGRRHLELASTYKDLAIAEEVVAHFSDARQFYYKALHEFEAVGNHRYVAIVENNIGLLLLNLGAFEDSECHLLRATRLFEAFSDAVRGAQVNDTLARLYVATERYALAQEAINKAVKILEHTDGEALLAEALTTNGLVESKLGNFAKAKSSFQAGCNVAERCGDYEGAGRALLILLEELGHQLEETEKLQLSEKLTTLFATTQQPALHTRIKKCMNEFGQ